MRTSNEVGAQKFAGLLLLAGVLSLLSLKSIFPGQFSLPLALFILSSIFGILAKRDSWRGVWIFSASLSFCIACGLFSGNFLSAPPVFSEWPMNFYKYETARTAISEGVFLSFPEPFAGYVPSAGVGPGASYLPAALSFSLGNAPFSWRVWAFLVFLALPFSIFGFSGRGRAGALSALSWIFLGGNSYFAHGNIQVYIGTAVALGFFSLLLSGRWLSWKSPLLLGAVFFFHQGIFLCVGFVSLAYLALSGKFGEIAPLALFSTPAILFGSLQIHLAATVSDIPSVIGGISNSLGRELDYWRFAYEVVNLAPILVFLSLAGAFVEKDGGKRRLLLSAALLSAFAVIVASIPASVFPPRAVAVLLFGHFVSFFFLAILSTFSGNVADFRCIRSSLKGKLAIALLAISAVSFVSLSYGAFSGDREHFESFFGYEASRHGELLPSPLLSGTLSGEGFEASLWGRENPLGTMEKSEIDIVDEYSGGYFSGVFSWISGGEFGGILQPSPFSESEESKDLSRKRYIVRRVFSSENSPGRVVGEFGAIRAHELQFSRNDSQFSGCLFSGGLGVAHARGICPNSSSVSLPYFFHEEVEVVVNGKAVPAWEDSIGRVSFKVGQGEGFSVGFSVKSFLRNSVALFSIVFSSLSIPALFLSFRR